MVKVCGNADAIVVAMGPGQAGTGTEYGFSGIEQGQAINAAHSLGGTAVLVPRISFSDLRRRHFGLSHHTTTILDKVVLASCIVVLPELSSDRWSLVRDQLNTKNLSGKHIIVTEDGMPALKRLQSDEVNVTTMGRTILEDLEFFLAPGAAGVFAGKLALEMKACV